MTSKIVLLSLLLIFQAANAETETCPVSTTPSDLLGPFYLPNTPWRTALAPQDQLDNVDLKLTVKGQVFGNDCVPMKRLLIEPWYAGLPDENGDDYSSANSDYDYRGQFLTDDCGRYQFEATFPEVYTTRPIRHIHFKFSTWYDNNYADNTDSYSSSSASVAMSRAGDGIGDGGFVGQELLVTQMYFEGYITEGYYPDPTQIATIEENDVDGSRIATWNVHLDNIQGTSNTDDGVSCSTTTTTSIEYPNIDTVLHDTDNLQQSSGGGAAAAATTTTSLGIEEELTTESGGVGSSNTIGSVNFFSTTIGVIFLWLLV